MGSEEILKILRKADSNLTAAEISEITGAGIIAIRHGLKRLLKDVSEHVETRSLTQEEKVKRFGKIYGPRVFVYWLAE